MSYCGCACFKCYRRIELNHATYWCDDCFQSIGIDDYLNVAPKNQRDIEERVDDCFMFHAVNASEEDWSNYFTQQFNHYQEISSLPRDMIESRLDRSIFQSINQVYPLPPLKEFISPVVEHKKMGNLEKFAVLLAASAIMSVTYPITLAIDIGERLSKFFAKSGKK